MSNENDVPMNPGESFVVDGPVVVLVVNGAFRERAKSIPWVACAWQDKGMTYMGIALGEKATPEDAVNSVVRELNCRIERAHYSPHGLTLKKSDYFAT